jgi:glycine/D-amino acid oxidase-like deaminating enzyme
MRKNTSDVIVVGAGIVGVSIAWQNEDGPLSS